MSKEYLTFGVLLAGALAPTLAVAQSRNVDVAFVGAVLHDSNVSRTSSPEAVQRGVQLADTIYSPSIVVHLAKDVGRQSVFLNSNVGYSFHQANKQLDREDIGLSTGLTSRFGRCSGSVSADYRRGQSDLQDVVLRQAIKNLHVSEQLGLSTSCRLGPSTGFNLSGSANHANNSSALQRESDTEGSTITAGVFYGRPALGKITLNVSESTQKFPKRFVIPGQSDGYHVSAAGLTFDRNLGARIQGSATISYSSVDPLHSVPGSASGKFAGTTYLTKISYRPTTRLLTGLSLERGIRPSLGLQRSFDLQTVIGVNGSYALNPRLSVSLGANRSKSESKGVVAPTALTLTNSEFKTVSGDIRYTLRKGVSFGLNYNHTERDSNLKVFNYKSDSFGASTRVAF